MNVNRTEYETFCIQLEDRKPYGANRLESGQVAPPS